MQPQDAMPGRPITAGEFMDSEGEEYFYAVVDGQLIAFAPNSPEARAIRQRVATVKRKDRHMPGDQELAGETRDPELWRG
jgi:hypothetical protein